MFAIVQIKSNNIAIMERLGQEDIPRLDKALSDVRAEYGHLIQFASDGMRLIEYGDTGETEHHTLMIGDQEHVFNMPVKDVIARGTFSDLREYVEQIPEQPHYNADIERTISHPAYLDWKAALPDTTAFKKAAEEILLETREKETLPCSNCRGERIFAFKCDCNEGTIHYHDITDGTSLSDAPEDSQPNPECKHCHGTGEVSKNCPCCNGAGYMMKYPRMRFMNEETGEEAVLTLNLAELLVHDDIEVEFTGYQNVYANGDMQAVHALMFRIDNAINKVLKEIHLDPENVASVTGQSVGALRSEDVNSGAVHWQLRSGKVSEGTGSRSNQEQSNEKISLKQRLQNAQRLIAQNHAWIGLTSEELAKGLREREEIALKTFGKLINHDGIAIEDVRVMRPLRPETEAFNDLMDAVTANQYTLGYSLSFIATGEVGPSFYLLNQQGRIIAQLSNEYTLRDSIENAWLAFQKICAELKR